MANYARNEGNTAGRGFSFHSRNVVAVAVTHRVPGGGGGGHGRRGVQHAPLQVINLDPDSVKARRRRHSNLDLSPLAPRSLFLLSFHILGLRVTPFFSLALDKLNS